MALTNAKEMKRKKYIIFFCLLLSCLASCSPNRPEDFHAEGRSLARKLSDELKTIESIDDLEKNQAELKKSFNQLVDLMIEARKYQLAHPDAEWIDNGADEKQEELIDQLRTIYALPGGREKIEDLQREALLKLDAFENAMNMKS